MVERGDFMPYGSSFTDKEFFITTEPGDIFASDLLKDIEEYFKIRGFITLSNTLLHDAVYVLGDTYYPVSDKPLLVNYAYYDDEIQFVNAKLKDDIISNKITKYRIIDLKRKTTVIELDRVEGAKDLFLFSTVDEYKRWTIKELSSLYMIISQLRKAVLA